MHAVLHSPGSWVRQVGLTAGDGSLVHLTKAGCCATGTVRALVVAACCGCESHKHCMATAAT